MHLQFGQVSFLLTGDIEEPVEGRLVRVGLPLSATVLKSLRHGIKTSSTEAFLEAINPRLVVISAGQDNKFGQPLPGGFGTVH